MTLCARDLMEADVISVSPETPLVDVHRLFLEEEIHGAPVVNEDGTVVGVISSTDLLRAVHDEYDTGAGGTTSSYFRGDLPYSGPDWISAPLDFQDRLATLTAADAMVTELVSVPADAPLAEVAQVMRRQRIHRVLVLEGGQLCGVVTPFDLLAVFEKTTASRAGVDVTHATLGSPRGRSPPTPLTRHRARSGAGSQRSSRQVCLAPRRPLPRARPTSRRRPRA
jgi:CBS domain-containing protein